MELTGAAPEADPRFTDASPEWISCRRVAITVPNSTEVMESETVLSVLAPCGTGMGEMSGKRVGAADDMPYMWGRSAREHAAVAVTVLCSDGWDADLCSDPEDAMLAAEWRGNWCDCRSG